MTRVIAEQRGGSFRGILLRGITADVTCQITKGISYISFAKVTAGRSLSCQLFEVLLQKHFKNKANIQG